jgi:hypothetical protein
MLAQADLAFTADGKQGASRDYRDGYWIYRTARGYSAQVRGNFL